MTKLVARGNDKIGCTREWQNWLHAGMTIFNF